MTKLISKTCIWKNVTIRTTLSQLSLFIYICYLECRKTPCFSYGECQTRTYNDVLRQIHSKYLFHCGVVVFYITLLITVATLSLAWIIVGALLLIDKCLGGTILLAVLQCCKSSRSIIKRGRHIPPPFYVLTSTFQSSKELLLRSLRHMYYGFLPTA